MWGMEWTVVHIFQLAAPLQFLPKCMKDYMYIVQASIMLDFLIFLPQLVCDGAKCLCVAMESLSEDIICNICMQ